MMHWAHGEGTTRGAWGLLYSLLQCVSTSGHLPFSNTVQSGHAAHIHGAGTTAFLRPVVVQATGPT